MAASDDLSEGDVSFYEKARIHGDIEEERQRQTWKESAYGSATPMSTD